MQYVSITGWFDWEELYDLAVERAQVCESGEIVDTMVEIGVYKGKSMAYLLEKLKAAGKLGKVNVFGIDNFSYDSTLEEVNENLSFAKGSYHIHAVKRETASSWFPDRSCGMIMIDGDHSFSGCYSDCTWAWSKLRDGGMMIVHDYDNEIACPEVKGAVDSFMQDLLGKYGDAIKDYVCIYSQPDGVKCAVFFKPANINEEDRNVKILNEGSLEKVKNKIFLKQACEGCRGVTGCCGRNETKEEVKGFISNILDSLPKKHAKKQ